MKKVYSKPILEDLSDIAAIALVGDLSKRMFASQIMDELNRHVVVASRSLPPNPDGWLLWRINPMGKAPSTKRVWTFLEIVISTTLVVAGLLMLQEGIANKATGAVAMLILGAVCSALGVISLIYAIRYLLWHRHMLQVGKLGPATSKSEHRFTRNGLA